MKGLHPFVYEKLRNLLTEEFLKDTTLFTSFEEFIRLLPVAIKDDPLMMTKVHELDLFIADTTAFASWAEFLKAAMADYSNPGL
ncbi:hypothetical protein [Halobacillus massiliensis]|uniref:hypothetical protein n=1 Tax=Halobacillus massiliensis TaxID=1926286 RepID=UPI0009E5C071|nr:hypothetical protein [Halobacillus massiliensis]